MLVPKRKVVLHKIDVILKLNLGADKDVVRGGTWSEMRSEINI
jgi:hypothetical protein